MPKNEKSYTIYEVSGDQHGEQSSYLYTDDCGRTRRKRPQNEDGFVQGVQPTNPVSVFNKLATYLTEGNHTDFENLLGTDFIYPGMIHSYNTNNDHSQGDWFDYKEKTYYVRPNVEALFIEKFDLFIKLVNLLIEKNDKSFYEAFKNRLAGTSLENASLFEWDTDIQQKISKQIADLRRYGGTLLGATTLLSKKDTSANTRGNQIEVLTHELDTQVNSRNAKKSETTDKEKFENLQFKLRLVQHLHQNDSDFKSHRGWKRFAVNFVTILFSVGIANLMKWFTTGNALFFSKTTTQEKISNVHTALGFDQNDEIHFNEKNKLKT